MRTLTLLAVGLFGISSGATAKSPAPTITYIVRVDSTRCDLIDVTMRLSGGPARLRLAMRVHQEYDAQFWRYLQFAGVTRTSNDKAAGITRRDTTLWDVSLPGG